MEAILTEPDYMTLAGSSRDPLSHFRAALLAVAMVLSVLLATFLTTIRPTLHKVSIDLATDGLWSDAEPQGPRAVHRLDIDVTGSVYLDQVRCENLLELRHALDLLMQTLPEPEILLRPDPYTRHEDFLQILAVVRQANVTWLKLDVEPLTEGVGHGVPRLGRTEMPRPARGMRPTPASLTYTPRQSILAIPLSGCAAGAVPDQPIG